MSNVIYAHIEERPEGKDTLVKDLGKKNSIFAHPEIGMTFVGETSANWRDLLTDNKRQRLKMKKQRISPNQDQTYHFKQNL